MGVFEDYEKAVLDVEYNNCTLEELKEAEQRLKDRLIEWHPYTQEKPCEDKMYLVTYHYVNDDGKPTDATTYAEFKKGHFHNVPRVTAWAELPKPYEKGTK